MSGVCREAFDLRASRRRRGLERLVRHRRDITPNFHADVKVGVIFHPSCHIVAAHGGEVHALAKKVKAPHYIMPAKSDDPALYGPEGSVIKELPAGSKQKTFPEQEHGWTSRGDASDPAVAAAIKDAMTEAFGYLKEHLPLE